MSNPSSSYFRPYPAHSLEKALVIVEAIVDKGASKPMDRLLVADAVGRTPSSSEFKRLLSSSRAYGLTIGTEKADYIAPTDIGLKIVKPVQPDEVLPAKIKACLSVDLLAKVWRQFNKQKLPETKFLKNTLERSYGLSAEHAEEFAGLVVENAKFCGVLQDISGSKYIRLDDPIPESAGSSSSIKQVAEPNEDPEQDDEGILSPPNSSLLVPSIIEKKPKLFLAHGKESKAA